VAWYRKSADNGDILALDQLGVLYANGQGVARNDQQAVELFRKAAEKGWFKSQFNLGFMYDQGRGVLKDPQMAYYWWSIAKTGNSDAEKDLDRIGPTLSSTQRATAQERARQFKPNYR
jgi:TPR repeat protein